MYNQNYKYLTTDDYDLSQIGMGWQSEYLPTRALKNIEYLNTRSEEIKIMDGRGTIKNIVQNTPDLTFKATNISNATIELPRLYYFGYQIIAKYENSEEKIKYHENKNGFIEINLEKDAIIEVTYTGTKLSRLGNSISCLTMIVFIFFILIKEVYYKWLKKQSV